MGWSWPEYTATPTDVIHAAWLLAQDEQREREREAASRKR